MQSIYLIKNPLDYQIPIFDDFTELYTVFAQNNANLNGLYDKDNPDAIISKDGFSFCEDNVLPYFYFFLTKYFDKNIQHKFFDETTNEWYVESETFYHYGWNYYTYDSICLMIRDIKETLELIDNDFDNPKLDKFRELLRRLKIDRDFMHYFYPKLNKKFELLDIEEQDDFIYNHLDVIIDLYQRFIEKLIKLMNNNPNCHFICFQGP